MTFRKRFLEKLAQAQGSPPPLNILSLSPTLQTAYKPNIIPYINSICQLLNIALFYSSNGKENFTSLYKKNFNFQPTTHTVELKKIVDFSTLIYQQLFKNNNQFKSQLPIEQVNYVFSLLENNQALLSLPQTNLSSPMGTRLGGDLKTLIRNILTTIKTSIG